MNTEAKRLLMAFALTFAFLFVWTKYFTPKHTPTPASTTTTENQTQPTTSQPVASTTQTPTPSAIKAPASSTAATIETYETKTNEFKGVFSTQSGALTQANLTNYLQELGQEPSVAVIPLVQDTKPPLLWNLSFRSSPSVEPQMVFSDDQTVYQWQERSSSMVSFSTQAAPDVEIVKSYRFGEKPYVIEQTFHIENHSKNSYYVDADTSLSATKNPHKKKGFLTFLQTTPDTTGVAYAHEEEFHWNFGDMTKGKAAITQAPIDWSGFSSQYFLLTAIPTEGVWSSVQAGVHDLSADMKMTYPQRTLAPGAVLDYTVKLYAGPKQIETLETVHPTLDRSLQLGSWIGGLARLIHKLLRTIYAYIPNYGWAIIILTVLVRLAVFPLAQMQAKSMKRMTQHKPAMDALKEKYASDREAYSRELMSYMRTNRINPASGCLPLLIQFPIFIALYRVLYNSIELRHAPFGLWIHDLSAHDPFFVLPVLVGITFYFQTKLNPTPMADPAQQTMMKIMPIMFSVFMIFLPSGLNLYIFVSTLWGIVQQYWVQKQLT